MIDCPSIYTPLLENKDTPTKPTKRIIAMNHKFMN